MTNVTEAKATGVDRNWTTKGPKKYSTVCVFYNDKLIVAPAHVLRLPSGFETDGTLILLDLGRSVAEVLGKRHVRNLETSH